MEKREFHNALRVLRSIDRDEIDARMTVRDWERFRDGPYEFFIKCDDQTCDAIWTATQRRMTA